MACGGLGRVWPELRGAAAPDVAEQLEIEARYRGYLDRQAADIAAFRRDEDAATCRRRSTMPPSAASRTSCAQS